jgi:hypothetical protein
VLFGISSTRHLCGGLSVRLAILFLPLNLFVLQAYQAGDAKTTAIVSPAQELSQPAFFDLVEGDSLKIVPEGPAGLSFDIFIYDAHTHELVGRSDDDSTDPSFQWTAAKSGRYSVVLHNVSPVDGKGLVTVVPRGSKAIGVGDSQEACFTVDSRKSCRALVEVPYATDRELLPAYSKNGKSIQAYGPEPAAAIPSGSGISYGVASVSIARGLQMGELVGVSLLSLVHSVVR